MHSGTCYTTHCLCCYTVNSCIYTHIQTFTMAHSTHCQDSQKEHSKYLINTSTTGQYHAHNEWMFLRTCLIISCLHVQQEDVAFLDYSSYLIRKHKNGFPQPFVTKVFRTSTTSAEIIHCLIYKQCRNYCKICFNYSNRTVKQFNVYINAIRAAPILLAIFFEKQEAKSKEQNSRKIGEKLEKWVSESCNLAYFALQRWRYSTRIVTNRIKSTYASGKQLKDRDTLIEQSPCCELL